MRVENAGGGIAAHTAGAILVAHAFQRYPLLEVSVKRNRSAGVGGRFEDVNPLEVKLCVCRGKLLS